MALLGTSTSSSAGAARQSKSASTTAPSACAQQQQQRLRAWHSHHDYRVASQHHRARECRTWASQQGDLAHPQLPAARDPLSKPQDLPLLGKRVMLTAPRQYAEKLSSNLLSAGARPLWVPGVAITALDAALHEAHLAALDRHLLALMRGNEERLTHVAFTSKNGIHAVLQRLAALAAGPQATPAAGLSAACDVLQASGVRLCALGADGQVLHHAGLPVHVSPQEASTLGLVKELEARGEARGARILCPVPLVTGGLTEPSVVPRFLAALQAAGAEALRAEAYVTTLGSTPHDCEAERRLLDQGHVHAIAFSSTAEAQGLLQLMGGQQAVQAAVTRHKVLLAAHGPYTAQGASQVLGLPVPCVSQSFSSFDGLVHALEQAFATPHHSTPPHTSSSSTSLHGVGTPGSGGQQSTAPLVTPAHVAMR